MADESISKVERVASVEEFDKVLEAQKDEGWSIGESAVVVTPEGGVAYDITFTRPAPARE